MSDWSSDVCSSDLPGVLALEGAAREVQHADVARAPGRRAEAEFLMQLAEEEALDLFIVVGEQGGVVLGLQMTAEDDRRAVVQALLRRLPRAPEDRKSTRMNSSH